MLGEPAVDDAGVANGIFYHRHFLHLIIENNCQIVADMCRSERIELAPALTSENKAHCRLAIFIGARFRGTKIAAGHSRCTRNQIPGFAAFGVAGANAFTGHQDSIRGQYAAVFLQGLLLTRIGPAQRLLDFKHRRRLHDFLDPRRIVHARKLD